MREFARVEAYFNWRIELELSPGVGIMHNGTGKGPTAVQIQTIELREIRLPLIHFFETSFGRTTERRIILVRISDRDGADGWGECTAGEGPFYSEEWTQTAWATLEDFLGPMLVGQAIDNESAIYDSMKRVRGLRTAKAAIETAC